MSQYSAIPIRTSARIDEIESTKLLQDEQIRLIENEKQLMMYYISGGNLYNNAGITDKVREEDQDLRGWFSEMYGENYIERLSSDAAVYQSNGAKISTSDKIAKIRADFELNPFGYILRTGAVNDYHLGRIVGHAGSVNTHTKNALAHSGKIVELCASTLLSGEVPNHNLFTLLHSSISNWYSLNEIKYSVSTLDKHLAVLSLTKPKSINHTTYLAQVIMVLLDIHKSTMTADTWHTVVVPNAEVEGITPEDITYMIEAIDGTGGLRQFRTDTKVITTPKVNAQILAGLKNWATWREAQETPLTQYDILKLTRISTIKVGEVLPRSFEYRLGSTVWNSNILWTAYDEYIAKETAAEVAQAAEDESGAKVKDYFMVPAAGIWGSLPEEIDGKFSTYKTKWIKYAYARVKQAYGFNYKTASLELEPQSYSPFPGLKIPHTYAQSVGEHNYLDISKVIAFYGQAYLGGTPTAYWSKNLSYRMFIRKKEGNKVIPPHSEIYLYSANIRTGGLYSESTLVGKATAEVETTKGIFGSFLPDIPLYNPGVNPQLTDGLKDSFSDKVLNTPSTEAWLRNGNKEPFHYAYVVNSSWDPTHKLTPTSKLSSKVSTALLGTQTRDWYDPSSPIIGNTHTDWMRATKWSNSKFKGVGIFSPSINTLRYDMFGEYQNHPEFYEGKNTIAATEMRCIAFPKATSAKIVEFMNRVPARVAEILNSVTNAPNSAWSGDTHRLLTEWHKFAVVGGYNALEKDWPEIPRKQYARAPGSNAAPRYFYDKLALRNILRPFGTFLENTTESLFIQDPLSVISKAYARLRENKPAINEKHSDAANLWKFTQCYDEKDFGEGYSDYMALLGAIAYFNSYHMFSDTGPVRTYPEWCNPFKGKVSAIVTSVIGSNTGSVIYSSQINDTEDVSIMHRVLKGLGAFEGMTELPVFDTPEFHVRWVSRSPTESKVLDSPFVNGYPLVPVGGLEAQSFPGLNKTYGDAFYTAILNSAILQPVFKQPKSTYYMYSSLRIPVSTIGVSSKTYGMRPGAAYSFDTVANTQTSLSSMFTGSKGLTYTGIAGMTGVAFIGLLGVAMFKNINNEGAFADVRFKTD